MHFIEKFGDPLDLVDDDPVVEPGRNEVAKALRIRSQFVEQFRFQQIDIDRIRECRSYPCGLSCPSRAERKKLFFAGGLINLEYIIPYCMTIWNCQVKNAYFSY